MNDTPRLNTSLVFDSDHVDNRGKGKPFLTVYRNQTFSREMPEKLAVVTLTRQWEPPVVVSYAKKVADI